MDIDNYIPSHRIICPRCHDSGIEPNRLDGAVCSECHGFLSVDARRMVPQIDDFADRNSTTGGPIRKTPYQFETTVDRSE